MMAGFGIGRRPRIPSAVENFIEEINFQRNKEFRNCLKDDSGYVMVQGTAYWTDLFVRHFLFEGKHSSDSDDLLFFVRKKHIKSTRYLIPRFQFLMSLFGLIPFLWRWLLKTTVEVFRKDSRKLPIGDPDIDWEETVYLNLIVHEFDYTITLAICTRTSPKDLQVLRRNSQKVYASPSRRKMDSKGEAEEMTYPNIFFMVDNFDEIFSDILARDGEMVCVELVASDREGVLQGCLFLGSIQYQPLKRAYDARTSMTSKMANRMSFGWFSGATTQRIEFVRMRGPEHKGHAELAIMKQKGCGAETPSSEPGVCFTDMGWDSDCEDDDMTYYPHRQRRMSDPSGALNTFVRSSWRGPGGATVGTGGGAGTPGQGARSRSENEGLDSYADGINEIESGDPRDVLHMNGETPTRKHKKRKSSTRPAYRCSLCSSKRCSVLPNGTKIHFGCPLYRKRKKELDDTTYNPLWSMRGFTQTFHFWKENKRAQSVPLHTYLTYVTLPWHTIIRDLLDSRTDPILTF